MRVFISYSHDSEAHRETVLQFAQNLREWGVDVMLDRFVPAPAEGWPRWMMAQVEAADVVLVVCTALFCRRFEGRETPGRGKGATFEGLLATQCLYDANTINEKFVPVLFAGSGEADIPAVLRPYTRYTLPDQFEALYRHLTDQPEIVAAPLGPRKMLPPRTHAAQATSSQPVLDGARKPALASAEVRSDGGRDASPEPGGRDDAKPWRTLPTAPAFLNPADRQSRGGLKLLDIQASPSPGEVPLPVLRFTLKNESASWLTLTAIGLEAICEKRRAVFAVARPVEPAAFWEVEIPETGGRQVFQAQPPIELAPNAATMVVLRLHVMRAGRDKVPPGQCGAYALRFEFTAGEGAFAISESIPC